MLILGKVKHGVQCTVEGCGNKAVRAVSAQNASKSGLNISSQSKGRIYLCEEHYKIVKKALKKEKKIEKWRLGIP